MRAGNLPASERARRLIGQTTEHVLRREIASIRKLWWRHESAFKGHSFKGLGLAGTNYA